MIRIILVFIIIVFALWFTLRQIDFLFIRHNWTSTVVTSVKVCLQMGIILAGLLLTIPASGIENSIIFIPLKAPDPDWNEDDFQFKPESVFFDSPSGNKIHAWRVKPNLQDGEKPDYCILYFHGNAGNLTYHSYYILTMVKKLNAEVFAIDYSGFGQSEGKPTENVCYQDARGALKTFQEKSGVKPEQIIVMGRSLGGAVAMQIASEMQKNNTPCKALVLESTYSSIPDMAKKLVPVLPVKLLLHTKMDTYSKLKQYTGPLYITHGNADRVVPFVQALRNKKAAETVKNRNGQFVFQIIDKSDHNDNLPQDYYTKMKVFLDGDNSSETISDTTQTPQQ